MQSLDSSATQDCPRQHRYRYGESRFHYCPPGSRRAVTSATL